jgi:hypothetical protein
MSMQKIKNSSSQALAYLLKELSQGTMLAKKVLSRTDFALGRFFAGIPESADQSQLDFGSSMRGLSREPMAFAHLIKSFINNPECAVLLEDSEPLTSDPLEVDPQSRARMTMYNGEVYWSWPAPRKLSRNEVESVA